MVTGHILPIETLGTQMHLKEQWLLLLVPLESTAVENEYTETENCKIHTTLCRWQENFNHYVQTWRHLLAQAKSFPR
jgi:hypothetical protein